MTFWDKFVLWKRHYCLKHLVQKEGGYIGYTCPECIREQRDYMDSVRDGTDEDTAARIQRIRRERSQAITER